MLVQAFLSDFEAAQVEPLICFGEMGEWGVRKKWKLHFFRTLSNSTSSISQVLSEATFQTNNRGCRVLWLEEQFAGLVKV